MLAADEWPWAAPGRNSSAQTPAGRKARELLQKGSDIIAHLTRALPLLVPMRCDCGLGKLACSRT